MQPTQAARRGLLSDMTISNHHHEKQVTSPQLDCNQAACTVAYRNYLLKSATSNFLTQLQQWWLLHATESTNRSCQHDVGSLYIQGKGESFVKLVHYLTIALLSLRGTCLGQFESEKSY